MFHDGARIMARVVSADAGRDIALLKVDTNRNLTPLAFAARVREGRALSRWLPPRPWREHERNEGNHLGRQDAGRREARADRCRHQSGQQRRALLNDRGEVVGMNRFVRREIDGRDYQAEGIGFAVSFDVLEAQFAVMKGGSSPSTPVARATPTPVIRLTATPAAGRGFGRGER